MAAFDVNQMLNQASKDAVQNHTKINDTMALLKAVDIALSRAFIKLASNPTTEQAIDLTQIMHELFIERKKYIDTLRDLGVDVDGN